MRSPGRRLVTVQIKQTIDSKSQTETLRPEVESIKGTLPA